jgi:GNAT superfamily N-acetyltransferase
VTSLRKIEARAYENLYPILAELMEMHLNLTAVLEGRAPGEIYADDAANPRTVYLISSDGHYLAGDAGNQDFNRGVNAALPRDTYFVLFCVPGRWANALELVLRDTYAIAGRRHYCILQQPAIVDWQARIPAEFSMQRLDAALLAQDLGNHDDVVDGILEAWSSVDTFLAHGFGSCLVYDGDIVSWSQADYVSGDRCEIGIHTAGEYRRQGLGTLTAAANAAHAIAQGFSTVGWHCWSNNAGSIGVAENVGFHKAAEYEVYINHWAAENVSDMTQDEFRAFAELYERQFETNPPAASGYPHIVAAAAWALAGDRQGCFRQLHNAVDLGWLRSADHLREIWPEFFWNPNLDQMMEWQDLVERFECD